MVCDCGDGVLFLCGLGKNYSLLSTCDMKNDLSALQQRWQDVSPLLNDPVRSVRFAATKLLIGIADLNSPQQAELDGHVESYIEKITTAIEESKNATLASEDIVVLILKFQCDKLQTNIQVH